MAVVRLTVPAGHKAGACTKDGGRAGVRYATNSVLLVSGAQGEQAYLASTDGTALSILPVAAEGAEQPQLLPIKAVQATTKGRAVEVNGEVRVTDGKKT